MGRTFEGSGGRLFTRLLGCAFRGSTYTVPPVEGQEVNGFCLTRVDPPRQLILEGRHRFAAYRLTYDIDEPTPGASRVRARTDADFPGIKGGLYRTFVITSGAHAFIVKSMLQRIARTAERSETAGSPRAVKG